MPWLVNYTEHRSLQPSNKFGMSQSVGKLAAENVGRRSRFTESSQVTSETLQLDAIGAKRMLQKEGERGGARALGKTVFEFS